MLCFSNKGRVFELAVYLVPEAARASKGKAIVNLLQLQEDEKIRIVLPVRSFDENRFVFMATRDGYVKKTPLCELKNSLRKGKKALELMPEDELIDVEITDGSHDVMLFSDAGKTVRFDEASVRPMGRGARGVIGMRLEGGSKLISMLVAEDESQFVLAACENGFGKCTPVSEYTRHGRATQGMIAISTGERNGKVVSAILVRKEDSVMLLTEKGKLVRTPVKDIRVSGRSAMGVTLINLKGDKLVRLSRIAEDDAENTSQAATNAAEAGTPGSEAATQETIEDKE